MFHAIGLFFRFLYHFLFINQTSGELSHTKFFSVIGYLVWCWAFPYSVIHGSQASFELWMVFGVVVIGNHTLQSVMLAKSGAPPDVASTWKGKLAAENDDDDDAQPPVPVVAAPAPVALPPPPPAPPPVVPPPVPAKPALAVPNTNDLIAKPQLAVPATKLD